MNNMNELAKMTGQEGGERVVAYKLNEVRMSGDDGSFSIIELLSEKVEGKYVVKPLSALAGVVLKMRWRLSRFDELPDGTGKYTTTSEYDDKNKDTVIIFGKNEKGLAVDLKEKYGLSSQRILYVYVPFLKEIVRVVVKPSALSGEKNPGKELGLFEYIDEYNASETYVHEYLTMFGSVLREDAKNKRKSYYAMTFKTGRQLSETELEKVVTMIKEVHQKTSLTNFSEEYVAPVEDIEMAPSDVIANDDSVDPLDSIPF